MWFFFFKQKTAYEMRISDWSSDVCSSDLVETHFPLVAAVGRAAAPGRELCVLEAEWGDESHPRIAIIGKGVCFDFGGLDIKPSSAMLLRKKDLGGAAHALALSRLVMASALPVRLHPARTSTRRNSSIYCAYRM